MKKALVLILLLSVVVGLYSASVVSAQATAGCAPVAGATVATVTAKTRSHIRLYTTTDSLVVATVPQGAKVLAAAIDTQGDWLYVCWAGFEGWSARDLYNPSSNRTLQNIPIVPPELPEFPSLDTDGDTVVDHKDYCPLAAGDPTLPRPDTGCPRATPKYPDSDFDGVLDPYDYCPAQKGDPLRARPYTGCPVAVTSALAACQAASPSKVCVNILDEKAGVALSTGFNLTLTGTCLFGSGNDCWVPVIAKNRDQDVFIVRAIDKATGTEFEGAGWTDSFGPVAGDLSQVPYV